MKSKSIQELSGNDKARVVFTQFAAIYLQKWTSFFKTDDSVDSCVGIWGQELEAIPLHQIQFAIKQLRKEFDEWPPSLFEFLRLCSGMTMESIGRYSKPKITYLGNEGAWDAASRELDELSINDPVALFTRLQPAFQRSALSIDSTNILDLKPR